MNKVRISLVNDADVPNGMMMMMMEEMWQEADVPCFIPWDVLRTRMEAGGRVWNWEPRNTKLYCFLLHHEGRCTRKMIEVNCFICSSLFPVTRDWPALSWFRKWWVELFWWQQNEHILEVGLYSVAFLSSHTKMGLMIISWLAAVICSRRTRRWNLGPYTLRCFSQFGLPCQYLSTALRTHLVTDSVVS